MPSNVQFQHPEYRKYSKVWELIQDVLDGERAVKEKKILYLPKPNPEDESTENMERYNAYLLRASFMPFTARTHDGMVGQVFYRDAVLKATNCDWLVNDVDGNGLTLNQQAKRVVGATLAKGRAGLLADYPNVTEAATVADLAAGRIRPTVSYWAPESIINWRVAKVGGIHQLVLVVLTETHTEESTEFEVKPEVRYRVLRYSPENGYTVEIHRILDDKSSTIDEVYQPKTGTGKPWDHIPFYFVGSLNNDTEPDRPPLEDLARLNLSHYRNSADYEESVFMVGQPTPWMSGLTEGWVKDVLNGTVFLGSRGVIPLPSGGSAGLLQATPNTLAFGAMEHKEKQAVALGAKLAEQKQVQRTATEAKLESVVEDSVLATVVKNVTAAYRSVLEDVFLFTNLGGSIEYSLNTNFDISRMEPGERAQLIAEWQSGAITWTEMRNGLRNAGVATEDDAKAKQQIAGEEAGPDLGGE